MEENVALKLRVSGVVQGVGFRPFVYRIAVKNGIKGYVKNLGGSEVEIHVEGSLLNILNFIRDLVIEKPPPAEIEILEIEESKPKVFKEFSILKSGKNPKMFSMIPPDIGICDDCLREILDRNSRWYMYPFNSCAWCGPRFSMIEKIPYDRENTSMRDFPLCEECLSEYRDPGNIRRFHAQGISCPKCGPKVWLVNNSGELVETEDPIKFAAKLIDEGYIVAIKGLGGFHIAALATNDEVVLTLRERKRRPQKPFALMALNIDVVKKIAYVPREAEELLLSPQKPIVLLPKRENTPISEYVAPGLSTIGVMLPYTGLHYILLMYTKDKYLIMTSGNPKGKPMCITNECALNKLSKYVDYILLHNRRIVNRVDDSVVRLTLGKPTFLRRSRGYAPKWFTLPIEVKNPIVAFGAELATAGAILIKNRAILTQYIGDVDDYETLEYMDEALKFLCRTYRVNLNEAVYVSDLHPYYATTRLAEEYADKYGSVHLRVQHHHAHIVSVMAENYMKPHEEIVGIAIDGVGYGIDGKIWGGEVLITSYKGFRRFGHLKYQLMPGGDLATKYPIRMLIGILYSIFDEEEILRFLSKTNLVNKLKYGTRELRAILYQLKSRTAPETSSIGRFLDATSALLGICFERTYEGEPAMKLEAYAKEPEGNSELEAKIIQEKGEFIIDTSDLMLNMIEKLEEGIDKRVLAYHVQYALGEALGKVAVKAVKTYSTKPIIAVSGGAAVNDIILKAIVDVAKENDIEVFVNRKVPPGDGGIALGQVAIVAYSFAYEES